MNIISANIQAKIAAYKNSVCIAFIFALLLFFKCILFAYLLNPNDYGFPKEPFTPYSIRIFSINFTFCLLIAAFSFLSKNKTWTALFAILLDIWLISNLLYFRSYNDLLNSWCILNISNMNGIWDSVLPFTTWKDLLFPLTTIVWWGFLIYVKKQFRLLYHVNLFFLCLLLAIISFLPTAKTSYETEQPINPFSDYYQDISCGRLWYCTTFSPFALFINETKIFISHLITDTKKPIVNSKEVEPFLNAKNKTKTKGNLLIIFFESFESWTINAQIDKQEITPYINKFLQNKYTNYCLQVIPQIRNGKSSDAQLIVNTGLLPTYDGAVSMRFYANTFPSLTMAFQPERSKIFIPTPSAAWNQSQMTKAFHYDALFAETISDKAIMQIISHEIHNSPQPFLFFVSTMASHAPFKTYADSSTLNITTPLSNTLSNYIKSVNYTDQAIGLLLKELLQDSILSENTTILITGDHTIFHTEKRQEFIREFQKNTIDINPQAFVPVMIYNKTTEGKIINDSIYQMDIYPTLLNIMNCNKYWWKGFGINMLDTAIIGRPITIKEANILSDKIIRNNYFKQANAFR